MHLHRTSCATVGPVPRMRSSGGERGDARTRECRGLPSADNGRFGRAHGARSSPPCFGSGRENLFSRPAGTLYSSRPRVGGEYSAVDRRRRALSFGSALAPRAGSSFFFFFSTRRRSPADGVPRRRPRRPRALLRISWIARAPSRAGRPARAEDARALSNTCSASSFAIDANVFRQLFLAVVSARPSRRPSPPERAARCPSRRRASG